jgi:predicted amidohydrolase YtcJ
MNPELILYNGSIHTMDDHLPHASALAIAQGRIIAVGSDDLTDLAGPATNVMNLENRSVIPGLTDCHIHFASFAIGLRRYVDLSGAQTLDQALACVAGRAAETPQGDWVLGRGWNQEEWPDRRFPNAADIDRVVRDHPTALTAKSGHAAVVNTAALERAGISADTPDPHGGRIERDESGQVTGLLLDEAMKLVSNVIPKPGVEERAEAIADAFDRAWRVGLTMIHDVDGLDAFDAFQLLHTRGELGLRAAVYLPDTALDEVLAIRLRTGLGDEWLRVGGIKAFADGALGPRTAAMLEPYAGEPDNRGLVIMEQNELDTLVRRATGGGLALAIHAIGDRANRMVLDAFAHAQPTTPLLRHRIEHAQIVHPDDVARFRALGVVASMQPIHATQDAAMVDRYWGDRAGSAYAWRSLLEAGAMLAFGSDCPVEDLNPFLGIHAAVTRACSDGYGGPDGWHPEQRLSVHEAVYGYTKGAAYAVGLEDEIGSLSVGKWADLLILDRDIFTCDPELIAQTRPTRTMIGGEFVIA